MRNAWWVAGAACTWLAAGACYPDRLDTTNYDIVATVFDSTADFGSAGTYSLADSIVHLTGPGDQDEITRAYDPAILATIRANMQARGYTEVADPATADLQIRVGATSSDYTVYYWDYWCSYWGWYYPYGCYYPGYGGTYTYTLGSLIILLSDTRSTPAADSPIIWFALGNGLLNQGFGATRVTDAVDQAFDQSPYLQHQP